MKSLIILNLKYNSCVYIGDGDDELTGNILFSVLNEGLVKERRKFSI